MSRWPEGEKASMSEIRKTDGICTQITTVKLPPDNQEEIVSLMIERARFMATQPGFVSVNLHRSKDGSHIVNYVQWTNSDRLAAAHHSPEFRKKWPRFGELVQDIEPCLYEVVHVEAA
jgi:heme-degrading monooxygenase HmoA